MKTINAHKLAIAATSAVMIYFTTGLTSIAQASELLKAEPIKQENLINHAQTNLALIFSTITASSASTEENANNTFTQEAMVTNKAITVSKFTLINELN